MRAPALTASNHATYVGLGIALFGMFITGYVLTLVAGPAASPAWVTVRQLAYFALAGLLLWLVLRRERLSLASIGWHTHRLWRSLLWGLLGFLLCSLAFGLSLLVDSAFGLHFSGLQSDLPIWLLALTVLRAGVVEELFYRGYAMERVKWLTGSTLLAWIIPLGVFTSGHLYLGWAGVLNAGLMGAVLAAFYWWRRDLLANMVSHFLVDFIPLVIFPWLAR